MNLIDVSEMFYKARDAFNELDGNSIDSWHKAVDVARCFGCSIKMDGSNVASALLLDEQGEIVLAPKGSKKQKKVGRKGRIVLEADEDEEETSGSEDTQSPAKRPKFDIFADDDES